MRLLDVKAGLISLALLQSLGCEHSKANKGAGSAIPVAWHPDETSTTLDPRLLEKSNESASSSQLTLAKLYHLGTKYADAYPTLQTSSRLIHGGYSVCFGKTRRSIAGVCYYFDERDQ